MKLSNFRYLKLFYTYVYTCTHTHTQMHTHTHTHTHTHATHTHACHTHTHAHTHAHTHTLHACYYTDAVVLEKGQSRKQWDSNISNTSLDLADSITIKVQSLKKSIVFRLGKVGTEPQCHARSTSMSCGIRCIYVSFTASMYCGFRCKFGNRCGIRCKFDPSIGYSSTMYYNTVMLEKSVSTLIVLIVHAVFPPTILVCTN